MSDSSRHSLLAIAETTYGTTPATPALKTIRHIGTTLAIAKALVISDELKANRQISDARHGTRQCAGEINGELSYGSYDDLIEAALCGTWASNVLKAGVTRRSFSVMRHFSDQLDADGSRHLFKGIEATKMTLGFTAGDNPRVNVGFGVIGQDLAILTAAITGSTFPAATTTKMMDCLRGSISEGGSSIGLVTELNMTLENGIQPRFVVASDKTIRPSIGRSMLNGTMTAFFENRTLLQKFLDEDDSVISFVLADLAGNQYQVDIPDVKYTGGQVDVSGQGAVTIPLPFQAIYDETADSQVVFTRTAAA